jgi:hypothetical protein
MSAEGGLVRGGRRGRWIAVAALCGSMLAWSAAPARAATGVIDGTPLNIYADDVGRFQVAFHGSAGGEFSPPALAPADAGLNIAFEQIGTSVPRTDLTVYGFQGNPFVPNPQLPPTVTGDGSPANPYTLTTQFTAGGIIRITETVTYVNGTTDVRVRYSAIAFDNAVHGRLYPSGHLSAPGVGLLTSGPPLQVGAINQVAGSAARLFQITPWQHYQESFYDSVFSVIRNTTDTGAPSLSDTVDAGLIDSAVGAQWNVDDLDATTPQVFSTTWRFSRFAALDASASTPAQVTGRNATVTVTARNADGGPDPGRAVRYSITGANPGGGTVTTGANGTAAINWTGVKTGTDTLTAFTDINGNAVRDANEPVRTATVTWTAPPPPPPPVPGKSVVVKVVSGTVFIKYPTGQGPRAVTPPKGFVPFTGAANIPVGSQLDTRKGRVALTSAADTGGAKTQTSDFYQGIFQVKQALPKKKPTKPTALTTDLVMKGQIARSQCAPLKGARAAAEAAKKKKGPKAVLGKLWGSGKGKFRTNGKYSAATVRGTIWLVEDRCEGTFTKVTRGTVRVRDFKRKKTVTVKAGHTYLARALRAATKSRR